MSSRVAPPTPPLICKFSSGGTGPLGALNYDAEKAGATLLWTSLEGSTPRSWARQIGAFRDTNKRLKRVVDHVSLSLDPRLGKLTPEQWLVAAKVWLRDMGYGNRAVIIHHHGDEPQDHIHLVICRLDALGQAHSDSNIFRRGHAAAVAAAEALGLVPLPRDGDGDDSAAAKPAPTDAAVAAGKRAKRRGTPTAKPGSAASAFDSLVSRCVSLDELEARACDAGLDLQVVRKSGGEIQGINVRAQGVDEWTKASALNRDRSLAWGKVQVRLAQNADRRARAQASADVANAAARARAEQRVAERLAAQPQPQHAASFPNPQVRALLPGTVHLAKEAAIAMKNDKLEFLNSAPPPRPSGAPIDGASFVALPAVRGGDAAEEEVNAQKRRLRLQEDDERLTAEMQAEIRALTNQELLDLRRPNVPDIFLMLAALERLMSLLLRLVSFGAYGGPNAIGSALVARQKLAELAEEELDNRRKSPKGAAERLAALSRYQVDVTARDAELAARQTQRKKPDAALAASQDRERENQRRQLEAGFDRMQVSRGHETLVVRQKALDDAAAEHIKAETEPLVAIGFGMALMPARRAKLLEEAAVARKKRADAAWARLVAAQDALDEYLQRIDDVERQEELKREQARVAVAEAEAQERADLSLELRELPEQIQAARAAHVQEQRLKNLLVPGASGAGKVTEAHVPPSASDQVEGEGEESAAEREREALRRLARGG